MPAVETLLTEDARAKARRKKLILTIIIAVVALHLAGGIVAGVVVVAKYIFPPPANFEVKKDIRLPAKQREHKMNMAAFDGMAPKPSFNDKMQSIRPTAFALPEVPKMDMDQMLPLDPSEIVSDQASSLVGTGGLGSGLGGGGAGSGGTMGGVGMSFFGIQSTGKRILLLFDVSTSVKNKADAAGVPLSKIKQETSDLITKLPVSARFGIIQFTQNFKPFNRELVPATDQNRAAALSWIDTEWVETGTMGASSKVQSNPRGLVGVLELAAKMQPDIIFLISDASFQWKPSGSIENVPWDEIKKITDGSLQGPEGCKIHFIGFEMKPEDKREIGSIVRKTGGKLRELK